VSDAHVGLEELAAEFGPVELHGHFALGRELPVTPPDGWDVHRMEGWLLTAHPTLPITDIVDAAGSPVGWIVGHPIDVEARRLVGGVRETPLQVPAERASSRFAERFEDWVYALGGRYVAIALHPSPRVMQDACGTFAVLYSPELEAAASSPFLLPNRSGRFPESDVVPVLDVHRTHREYFFGTTPLVHASQLLANHALDLLTWEPVRIWPRGPFDEDDLATLSETVAATSEAIVAAAVSAGDARMGLTAGGDTRVILACARPVATEIDFFTVAFEDGLGVTDLRWAPVLAGRFGLRHRAVPWQEASDRDVRLWLYHTGSMSGESRGRYAGATYRAIGGPGPFLSGMNGGMMHGGYWKRLYRDRRALQPERLVTRAVWSPPDPRFVSFAERWLEEVPRLSAANTIALWMMEIWDTCWGSSQSAAFAHLRPVNVHPLTHRAVVDACLRTSEPDRLSDALRRGTIAARWPELLDIPFNKPPTRVAIQRSVSRTARKARAGARKATRYGRGLLPGSS
jgi:hypothetical protein